MKTIRSELIKQHIDSFPVPPTTVTRLMKVTSNPDCSVQDIVDTIHSDQSLCLTVLKIANSVLFGRPKRVDSIKMAVVILGFDEVQRIALTKALINSFSKLARQHKPFIDKFWEHSFACGVAAKAIAPDLAINGDLAFMGGLLHDIGKLILLQIFEDDYVPERWMTTFSTTEVLHEELRMFSFTHDMLGGQLLRKWLFPETLITAVAYHHRSDEAVRDRSFAHTIQLADLLSFYCCNAESPGDDEILTAVDNLLPEVRSQWHGFDRPLENEAIIRWFNRLVQNHQLDDGLKAAFSA